MMQPSWLSLATVLTAILSLSAPLPLLAVGTPAVPRVAGAPEYLTISQLQKRYRLHQSRFATIEGAQIHYTDEGRGPVIVLLHGSSSSLRTYDRVVKRLKGRYRIISYDEPNMGLSGPAPRTLYERELYPVLVLEGLLAKLNVRKATLVGVSSGGAAAFFFAAKHPEMVDRLILSNTPSGRADGRGMRLSQALAREIALSTPTSGRQSKIYRPRSYWEAFFQFYTGEPERIGSRLIEQYYDMNRRVPAPDRLAMVAALDDAQGVARALAAIKAPTLLLWGARDPILPPQSAADLAAGLRNAQVSTVMMRDVGHYPPLEVPERFANLISAWLADGVPIEPKAPEPADRQPTSVSNSMD
jgi:pimeloyl-ACP methyl ester carboxylesterase